ncbi:MAG: DUF2242 domain-containing protein [Ottowia sp.]|nr:DUF2242 domain-containing protein [Ottowia sp.]
MNTTLPAWIRAAAAVLLAAALSACAGLRSPPPMPNYQPEAFDGKAFQRHFDFDAASTCEAARRALLSQGYLIGSAQGEQVLGRKHFQPSPEHHVQLEFTVVCAAELKGGAATTAFVSALKDQYVVRKSRESASVRLGAIASWSMPVEGSMESMGKVASETITDPALYERFFHLVQGFLERYPAQQQASAPAADDAAAADKTATTLEQDAAVLAADTKAWRDAEARQVEEADKDWKRARSASEAKTEKVSKKRAQVRKKTKNGRTN